MTELTTRLKRPRDAGLERHAPRRMPLWLQGADPGDGADPVGAASGQRPDTSQRKWLVHYVEDNETNALLMHGMLSHRPRLELQVSANGQDGLAAIRATRPDLVLLDMHLPDIDGIEVLRRLKALASTTGIPVVVVSADATASRIRDALAAGAEDYLTKPIDMADFLAQMDAMIARLDKPLN